MADLRRKQRFDFMLKENISRKSKSEFVIDSTKVFWTHFVNKMKLLSSINNKQQKFRILETVLFAIWMFHFVNANKHFKLSTFSLLWPGFLRGRIQISGYQYQMLAKISFSLLLGWKKSFWILQQSKPSSHSASRWSHRGCLAWRFS